MLTYRLQRPLKLSRVVAPHSANNRYREFHSELNYIEVGNMLVNYFDTPPDWFNIKTERSIYTDLHNITIYMHSENNVKQTAFRTTLVIKYHSLNLIR